MKIRSQRKKKKKKKKINIISISSVYTACVSKRIKKGVGLKEKAKRFQFDISVNFKQLLIFIKCFQQTFKAEYACNEKALFTIKKKHRSSLYSESKRQGEGAISLALLGRHGDPLCRAKK